MSTSNIVGIILQSVTAVLSLIMIVIFLLRGRKTKLLYSYVTFEILIFLWAFFQMLQEFNERTSLFKLFTILAFLPISFMGPVWLLFCLLFTRQELKNFKRFVILLSIQPTLIYSMVLTNDYHHLFFIDLVYGRHNEYGPVYWVHCIVSYTLLIIGTFILIKNAIRNLGYVKKQSIIIIIATATPILLNMLAVSKLIPSPGFDITTVCFSFSLSLFALATYKYKFLDIVPTALKEILSNMREMVIVVDSYNNIIYFNQSFLTNFSWFVQNEDYKNMSNFMQEIRRKYEIEASRSEILTAIEFGTEAFADSELWYKNPEGKYFYIYIHPIFRKKRECLGRVICLSDVSNYKRLMGELDIKNNEISTKNKELTAMNRELTFMNQELTSLNEQLIHYSNTVEELTLVNERNRMAKDLHDTLGHTMTLIITLLSVGKIECMKDPKVAEENMDKALAVAREGLNEIRRSIVGLKPKVLEEYSFYEALNGFLEKFKATDIAIDLSIEGEKQKLDTQKEDVIYRICQEAVTNSIKHGNSKNVSIILKFSLRELRLYIFDDGKGCDEIVKNTGLQGMEDRIKSINGNIIYGSGEKGGFNINVRIPLRI